MTKNNTGTKEWAKSNVNIQTGCEHGCRYCYARHNAVVRFGWCTQHLWDHPTIDPGKIAKNYRRRSGSVMFPSSHDITPGNIDACMAVLGKLLQAGNRVLIVSKPHFCCVERMVKGLAPYKKQAAFRFSIGSVDDEVLAFWEPGAPKFLERYLSLALAYMHGYETSVSCEPYLDGDVRRTHDVLKSRVTDSFWIGRIRQFAGRVNLDGATEKQRRKFVEPLRAAQTDESVRKMRAELDGLEKIQWKDSMQIGGE